MSDLIVVHYVNQFFAGFGGEEKADAPPGLKEGSVGPGRDLEGHLPEGTRIAWTIYCGDNYFSERRDEVLPQIVEMVRSRKAQLLIAGPAFDAGRYGFACAETCNVIAKEIGIPCLTAMYPENPGVDMYQSYKNVRAYLLSTTATVVGMQDALSRMGRFATRLLSGEAIGPAAREGYLPRGIRRVVKADKIAVERAIDMLLAKVSGEPFTTEVPVKTKEPITPAGPFMDLARATIALANTSGVVPWGNPDGFKRYRNVQWKKYSIQGTDSLEKGKWEAIHGGYSTVFVNDDPNCGNPVDALRMLEKERVFLRLLPYYYVTPGNVGSEGTMEALGREMAEDMKAAGVNGVVLVST